MLGEHVQSRSGRAAGALSTWGLLFGVFAAWKLLVCEFLLLFLSPGIFTGVRGCLQLVLSSHKPVRERVTCVDSYPQPQGLPAVLHPDMPRDVQPHSEIVPKTQAHSEVLWGWGTAWEICPSESPCCGVEGGTGGTQGSAGCDSTVLQQGCHRAAVAQPVGWRGWDVPSRSLSQLPQPPTGALESISSAELCFPDCV